MLSVKTVIQGTELKCVHEHAAHTRANKMCHYLHAFGCRLQTFGAFIATRDLMGGIRIRESEI